MVVRLYDSLVPWPPHLAFVACSMKCGGKAWKDLSRDACLCWHHVQSAHIWVYSLPFSLLSPNSVHSSVQFFLRVRLLLDWSWLATVRDISSGTHHVINPSRPSPAFHTASDKCWVWRSGNEASCIGSLWLWLRSALFLALKEKACMVSNVICWTWTSIPTADLAYCSTCKQKLEGLESEVKGLCRVPKSS